LKQNHTKQGHSPFMYMRPSMKLAAFEVALKEKKNLAEGTLAFRFEKPKDFPARAGQHLRMTLLEPPETDSAGTSRFFSLANAPHETDLLIAMRMRDTAFKRVLGRLQIGEKVCIETMLGTSPHASLTLHEDASKPAVFLIGGIGIAPAFAIIKDALARNLPHPLFLFYSNRRAEDAPFLDELEQLARHHPSFTLIPTLTAPETSATSWHGETGRIDQAMIKRYAGDLASPIYYIAGLPEMASAMKAVLTNAGVSEDQIHVEEFSGFIMGQHGPMGQHERDLAPQKKKPLLVGAVAAVIILMAVIHTSGALLLAKMGLSTSLTNPIFLGLIGLALVMVLFKFKHALGLVNRKKANR
jgi:ferredoxin-NADP reductase